MYVGVHVCRTLKTYVEKTKTSLWDQVRRRKTLDGIHVLVQAMCTLRGLLENLYLDWVGRAAGPTYRIDMYVRVADRCPTLPLFSWHFPELSDAFGSLFLVAPNEQFSHEIWDNAFNALHTVIKECDAVCAHWPVFSGNEWVARVSRQNEHVHALCNKIALSP